MKGLISAVLSGTVFGLGLSVSQMTNPEKVKGFLDIFGQWDPSLALVMCSALITTGIGFKFVLRRSKPLFDKRFLLPTSQQIDTRLSVGAVLFGIGWGLSGLCPGPAIAGLGLAQSSTYVFIVSMAMGMFAFHKSRKFWTKPAEH